MLSGQNGQGGSAMKQTVIAFLSISLNLVYFVALMFAIRVDLCVGTSGCTQYTTASFNTGYVFILSTVGGLISALVVGVLAATDTGEGPTAATFGVATTTSN